MTYGELTRRLRRLGYEFQRRGRGSHEFWWHPDRRLYTIIPNHRGREVSKGTLARILRDLGLTEEDLRNT